MFHTCFLIARVINVNHYFSTFIWLYIALYLPFMFYTGFKWVIIAIYNFSQFLRFCISLLYISISIHHRILITIYTRLTSAHTCLKRVSPPICTGHTRRPATVSAAICTGHTRRPATVSRNQAMPARGAPEG